MFAHIREGSEIDHFKECLSAKVITLLVIRNTKETTYGNISDDNVLLYNYDYQYDNNCSLEETEQRFIKFLEEMIN